MTVTCVQGAWTYTYGEGSTWEPGEQRESIPATFTMTDVKPDSNFHSSLAVKKFIANIAYSGKKYLRS